MVVRVAVARIEGTLAPVPPWSPRDAGIEKNSTQAGRPCAGGSVTRRGHRAVHGAMDRIIETQRLGPHRITVLEYAADEGSMYSVYVDGMLITEPALEQAPSREDVVRLYAGAQRARWPRGGADRHYPLRGDDTPGNARQHTNPAPGSSQPLGGSAARVSLGG